MANDRTNSSSDGLDYGRAHEFGYFLDPAAAQHAAVLDTARLLDPLGLDLLSGGRFEMGIGAGGLLQAAHAMGAPALSAGQSLAALEETVTTMRAMWSGERRGLKFDGRYDNLRGVHPGPEPAHTIANWIGGNKPRALALTSRIGDGWVSPLMMYKPPAEAAEASRAIDRAATEAGRHPRDIRRIYNIQGSFTRQPTQALDTDGDITGPPERWSDVLTHFALDLGFDTFILAGDNDGRTLATFITEVAPAVRHKVAEAGASSPRDALTERGQLS